MTGGDLAAGERCPACKKPRTAGLECAYCGIIFERWLAARAAAEARAPRAPKAPEPAAPPPPAPARSSSLKGASRALFLELAGEALAAGQDLSTFARGPGVRAFGPWVAAQLESAGSGSPAAVVAELAALDAADRALLAAAGADPRALGAALIAASRGIEQRKSDLSRLAFGLGYPAFLLFGGALVPPLQMIWTEGIRAWLFGCAARLVLVIAAFLAIAFGVPAVDPEGRRAAAIGGIAAAVPPFDRARWHRALGRFARTLGASLTSGVTAPAALRIAAAAARHPALTAGGPLAAARLEGNAGVPLADALSSIPELPAAFVARIGHGERVSTLSAQLERLAAQHEALAVRASRVALRVLAIVVTLVALGSAAIAITEAWSATVHQLGQGLELLQ